VAAVHRVWAVRDGKAWVARLDPRDKTEWPSVEIAPANSLVQVDLTTGAETEWFYRAGAYPWMIGLASGRPLIAVGSASGQSEIRVLDQPGSDGKLIYSGNLMFDGYFQNYQGDGDRIWLGGEGGIYLYRPRSRLTESLRLRRQIRFGQGHSSWRLLSLIGHVVGRSFRNANRDIAVVGEPTTL
jgi:hypothetical protein